MPSLIRISPMPSLKPQTEPGPHRPLFQGEKPIAIIGECRDSDGFPLPIQPSASMLFGPRGACVIADNGPLWIADTGHHRLLGWKEIPTEDHTPADWLLGQPDFSQEGRNAKGLPNAGTLNVPTGVAKCGNGMVIADAWNHRVLMWFRVPEGSHLLPDRVLGQPNFTSTASNQGQTVPTASSLHWPYGVHAEGDSLFIADTGNRRVLIWHALPRYNGQPADVVLGQTQFDCRDENAGSEPNAMSMRWPHAITIWNGNLCVADAGNNRIMIWDGIPLENGTPARWILGQPASDLVDHNNSLYWPRADTLNMPYGVTASGSWLIAADTANSRLVGWQDCHLETGAKAEALLGQPSFEAKGDNQWRFPVRGSLCWPYHVQVCGKWAIVADSGNNRAQLWTLNDELGTE